MDNELESTGELILALRAGKTEARDRLFRRCLPPLRSWARGRLPRYGRDLSETDDLVQITLLRALDKVEDFVPEREGSLLAYLRTVLLSIVRDEVRRTARARQRIVLAESLDMSGAKGEDGMADLEELEAFEAAVAQIEEPKRSAVILRVEMGMDYDSIAAELGFPSGNAARMAIQRALAQLAGSLTD